MTFLSPEDLKAALPRWRSHKVVQAARILEVRPLPLRFRLDVGDDFEQRWFQPKALSTTVAPEPGWWLVLYDDGYISFSPAKAFEEGYSPHPPTVADLEKILEGDGPAAAAAPQVPRICGAMFEVGFVSNHTTMACTYPAGHDGPHGRAFPHT